MGELGEKPEKAAGQRSQFTLFLSVNLLLLAFFILLTSIASFQEVRSKAVLESLSTTFADILPVGSPRPYVANYGEVLAAREFQTQVAQVFQTAIPAARVAVTSPGRVMQVEFHADALFLPGKPEVRPGQGDLLDRIVAAVSKPPPGIRYAVEFVIGLGYPEAGGLPIGETLQMARAGGFAREMLRRGAPPRSLLAGMETGDPDKVTIVFRAVDENEGRLDFAGGGG